MEAKHSPSPWILNSDSSSGCIVRITIKSADGHTVHYASRHAWDPDAPCKSVYRANNRLIAAAPELLEALKEVVAIADRKTDVFDKARAAIAKAEGKEAR